MIDSDDANIPVPSPVPAEIEVKIDGWPRRLTYEQAFALGCDCLEQGHIADAAKLFERLEEFIDRGPRAFIMQAFCEAATSHYQESKQTLAEAFQQDDRGIATALHDTFVSYHIGIRKDALRTMVQLVNTHQNLPTLCLLLGNMLDTAGRLPMARKCWSLAVHRDRPGGAVAAVALQHLQCSADTPSTTGENSESQ